METQNPSNTPIVELLSTLLADSYSYQLLCQNFHWNITGPHFHSLHVFFEEQYKQVHDTIDEIAEKIRTFGAFTPASLKTYQHLTQLNEADRSLTDQQMLAHLHQATHTMCVSLKKGITVAEKNGSPSTADLLTQLLTLYEKSHWMISSLQT